MFGYKCRHSQRYHGPHVQTPTAGSTLFWKPCRNRGEIPCCRGNCCSGSLGITIFTNYETLLGKSANFNEVKYIRTYYFSYSYGIKIKTNRLLYFTINFCVCTTSASPLTRLFGHPQVFSCRLGNEQETALSIIDPVNIQVELCGSPTYQSSSGLLDAFNVEDIPPLLEVKTSLIMQRTDVSNSVTSGWLQHLF